MYMDEDSDDGMERRAYRITGRVQGVGFRWWTRTRASELGLGGHVRNCRDGSVELHVVGRPHAVERMEAAVKRGPSSARVEDVEALDPDPDMVAGSFHIAR